MMASSGRGMTLDDFTSSLGTHSKVRFEPDSELNARYSGLATALAATLKHVVGQGETIYYGLQIGESLRRAGGFHDAWAGEMTWWLATDVSVVRLGVKGVPEQDRQVTTICCRRYPMAALRWSEIEETHQPGEPLYKLTMQFADGEKAELESLKLEPSESKPEAVRLFAAALTPSAGR